MKKIFTLLSLLLLTTTTCIFAGGDKTSSFPDISIQDLKTAIEAKQVVIFDVNGTKSWQAGHIPGAIDFATSQEKLASLLPQDKNALIVAYCGGPKCGAYARAAEAAKKLGYTNVKHLSAGISGWVAAKEQTEKGS